MSVALSCTTYEITGHFRLLIVYHLFHKHKGQFLVFILQYVLHLKLLLLFH
ncbi:hypothetical protein BHE74_00008692 [Ensete ventricosum]|uniref:Uncharacterized protein n=1 Tax=Ensete ventricosum TaxID=4639 RepID=A0A426ZVX1_ENSVE|nr:hypothetical protein B296_00034760 [Ensete ventricosum]RWW21677.1 hypothetical protein GW17_00014158 [Ensete ventricosum]RWW82819.1 hypothetical protein BHE74_00008692 [Ensete ventricosum]RZR87142.1 hypothetical protein BHM03_00014488 [Ensete ventricosum]